MSKQLAEFLNAVGIPQEEFRDAMQCGVKIVNTHALSANGLELGRGQADASNEGKTQHSGPRTTTNS